jgi:hypothetical protein
MTEIVKVPPKRNDLLLDGQQPCGSITWIDESYRNSEDFWCELKDAFDAGFSIRGVSTLFGRYDFYHDIILRNSNNMAAAFSWRDATGVLKEISFSELGVRASVLAAAWARRGLSPGKTLCIIRPMGPELVSELLAALKMGLIISLLPLQGKGFLERRLKALSPDYISTDESHFPLLSDWRENILPEDRGATEVQPDAQIFYAYSSGETVFRCFDPCSSASQVPTDVSSDAAYLSSIRDGIVGLGLGQGDVYAAPGFHFLETMPSLLLAGLLCGATFMHLLPEDIAAENNLVTQRDFRAFGVSKRVRDLLLENPVDAGNYWESWFRNPAETLDLEKWQFFVGTLNLKNAFAFNLKWDAALGGCSFLSFGRRGMTHMNVMPAPGSSWTLQSPVGVGSEAPGDYGIFSIAGLGMSQEKKRTTPYLIIRKNSCEWTFVGTHSTSRDGRCYPVDEVLETVRNLQKRFSLYCSIVQLPLCNPAEGTRMVLLVFTGFRSSVDKARVASEMRGTIATEMGAEFLPDTIEFFSLYPRFLPSGEIDDSWCQSKYQTGLLSLRSQSEIFTCLTGLREVILNLPGRS